MSGGGGGGTAAELPVRPGFLGPVDDSPERAALRVSVSVVLDRTFRSFDLTADDRLRVLTLLLGLEVARAPDAAAARQAVGWIGALVVAAECGHRTVAAERAASGLAPAAAPASADLAALPAAGRA